jgi:isoleucyl-tRNA synthetase
MYKSVDPKADFPGMEESILEFWKENGTFKKSISGRQGRDEFVFYDGPPFATGLPHFGHFVPGSVKDIIPRYKTMKGFQVSRRFGWDCHGLPVENLIEKELGLNSKTDIERYGVAKFNEACRASVLRYVKEWRTIMTRAGRWVDFDDDYKTMEPDYMESIWWVMKSLWDKGLVYEGHYILPYCPRCSTVLSNHELAQPGVYREVHDPAISVRFRILEGSAALGAAASGGSAYFVAWTTTPWTLPSNLALAVGPDIDYAMVQDGADRYIMAEARLGAYYKDPAALTVLWRGKGSDLVGSSYEPLFPYFAAARAQGAFKVYPADYVSTGDGAGIVHIAPGFGEDDYRILKGTGIPTACPVDAECRFSGEVPDYQGRFVKECDKDIMERLKAEGKLVKREQVLHSYPHCWRCDSPLIYRAVGSWFVKVEGKVKASMLKANSSIYWVPSHIKEGRFGKWLEGARDWAISRNRYWGNPLPIWTCECGEKACVGSRQELEKLSGRKVTDLHKHFVDDIEIPCSCGKKMRRIPEVLDCWFESGAMPYAQNHYPFENKEHFEAHYPADFISESLDQTRGWFYTLTVLAAALFDKPAFMNCVVSGMVLAADGKKMSKSQRNYTDPMEVINQYGADALRVFLMNSAVMKADDLRFSDEGVKDVLKSIMIPVWNAYSFYVTYANIDKAAPGPAPKGAKNPLDRWILSVCERMVAEVDAALGAYDLSKAIEPVLSFIDLLNNWYIRRSRRRFWRSENDSDKADAYSSLNRVMLRFSLAAAPVMPFLCEEIYRNLRPAGSPESVHLCDYPAYDGSYRDLELERKMDIVQKAVSMGRSLRFKHDLKVRQPLAAVHLVTKESEERSILLEMEEIVREELNVKEVVFRENEEELVEYQAKANFRALGKELGKAMKEAQAKIEALSQAEISVLLEGSTLSIEIDGKGVELTADKVEVRRLEKAHLKVVNEGSLTVALDSQITEALRQEGDARDLVRGIQNLRKESGLEVTDRIGLSVFGSDRLKLAYESFREFIASETLAIELSWEEGPGAVDIEAGDENWRVSLKKL